MQSLTAAELLVITPIHLFINVFRSRGTQMPFSKGSGIGFPLQKEMQANQLPWSDFTNLPFIVMVYDNNRQGGIPKQAKINLKNVIRALDLLSEIKEHPLYADQNRTRNRFITQALLSPAQIERLREELDHADDEGYSEPTGLRKIIMTPDQGQLNQVVPKMQVQNWILSGYPYALAVHDGCLKDSSICDGNDIEFEKFWMALKTYTISNRKEDNSRHININNDSIITYEALVKYFIEQKWINDIAPHNVFEEILEEFQVLASCFTNDEGPNFVHSSVLPVTTNDPDEIYQRNIRDTALDRRHINVDHSSPAPEWMPGYLPMAFPAVFLSGDADFHQLRPIPINKDQNGRCTLQLKLEYLRRLSMFKEVQENPKLCFVITTLIKKLDATKGATVLLKDVDVTSAQIPTREELLSNDDTAKDMSKCIMQFSSMIRDSKESWKLNMQDEVGTARDLYHMDDFSRPEKEHPILPALFRTMAFPYRSAYYFHGLMDYVEGEDISNINHRRAKLITESMVIEIIGTLIAECDLKYLAPHRASSVYYIGRDEKGANGNPHWHSLLYSDELGEKTWELKSNLENYFDSVCKEVAESSDNETWTEDEKDATRKATLAKWEDSKQDLIQFFNGIYTNWNPCFTSQAVSTGNYNLPDITSIQPSNIIDACLESGDFSTLDELYCCIVNNYCRHIVHRGKNGKPAKTDHCYTEVMIKDKKASEAAGKGKTVRKKEAKCKRRKPQDKRATPAIHVDPHAPKFYQLTYECNDGWFNGSDIFQVLLVLGNADCKALINSMFTKQPKFKFSENDYSAEMILTLDPGDSAMEYVIKYMQKGPLPIETPKEIFNSVIRKMDNNNLTTEGVFQVYMKAANQGTTPLLTAQHINLHLPQVLRNTFCTRINALGRRTIKKKDRNAADDDESFLNENRIDVFEERLDVDNLSPRYNQIPIDILQQPMSMHQFYDMYTTSYDKNKKLIVKKRNRTTINKKRSEEIYQSIRLTPHTTLMQANPTSKDYSEFCKKFCLWEKAYVSIRGSIPTFTPEEKEEESKYWIDQFNEEFPDGKGLEHYAYCYFQHYKKKMLKDVESDSDSDDDCDGIPSDDEETANVDEDGDDVTNKEAPEKVVTGQREETDRFYYTEEDLLHRPPNVNEEEFHTENVENQLDTISSHYLANANQEDFRSWLPTDQNPTVGAIEKVYTEMMNKKGTVAPVHQVGSLTKKQTIGIVYIIIS